MTAEDDMQLPPMDGLRVLDLSRFAAGPWATSLMGDMGADVIKVESRSGGDPSRAFDDMFGHDNSSYFVGMNRNKRSISLDLKTPDGKEVLRALISDADVVVESFRVGVMERLGLPYEELAADNPRLVYCHISGFGEEGPMRDEPGMDQLIQAFGGLMSTTGEPGRKPVRVGPPVIDYTAGFLTCWSVALALLARERDGVGQRVEVNLLHSQLALFPNFLTGVAHSGVDVEPNGHRHAHITPCQLFRASDGDVMICCLTQDAWERMCDALQLTELADDHRYRTNSGRYNNREELTDLIEQRTSAMSKDELMDLLHKHDVPASPVNSLASMIEHPQVRANDMVVEWHDDEIGPVKLITAPVRLVRTPSRIRSGPPRLGEHTREILQDLGYDEDRITATLEGGAAGPRPPERA